MMNSPVHPGEVLSEDFLKPLAISVTKAAEMVGVSRKHLSSIINSNSPISADMAARIGKLTNTSAKMWLGMQNSYDLSKLDMSEYEHIKNVELVPNV